MTQNDTTAFVRFTNAKGENVSVCNTCLVHPETPFSKQDEIDIAMTLRYMSHDDQVFDTCVDCAYCGDTLHECSAESYNEIVFSGMRIVSSTLQKCHTVDCFLANH